MNGDLISRKVAIEEIYKEKYSLTLDDKADVEEILNGIPTVFDVETVIAELEERLCSKEDEERDIECHMRNQHFMEAINIIKSALN